MKHKSLDEIYSNKRNTKQIKNIVNLFMKIREKFIEKENIDIEINDNDMKKKPTKIKPKKPSTEVQRKPLKTKSIEINHIKSDEK